MSTPEPDSEPTAVAIEVELSAKRLNDYVMILRSYKAEFDDNFAYSHVEWICRTERIERLLRAAANTIELPDDRIVITRLDRKQRV